MHATRNAATLIVSPLWRGHFKSNKKAGAKASAFISYIKLENLLQQFFQIVLTPQVVDNQTNPAGDQQ